MGADIKNAFGFVLRALSVFFIVGFCLLLPSNCWFVWCGAVLGAELASKNK